jgi:hypothetical protein
MSKLYCIRKNITEVLHKLTKNNLKANQAIIYLTNYLTPSNRKVFLETQEDSENIFLRMP